METTMRMQLSKRFALSLLSASLFIAGCGGGGDEATKQLEPTSPPETPAPVEPENKAPSVNISDASDLKEQVEFTLSASASDDDGEVAKYAWQHDSSLAISSKDTNTASPRFTVPDIKDDVDITFTVTVTDDDGAAATASKKVTVKRKVSSVTITGIVTDEPIPNADVFISVGEIEQQTKANAQGEYSSLLSVDDSEKSRLVKIRAVGPSGTKDENVEFVSQLNSVETLVEQAGDDGELTKEDNFAVNVTNVSTAEYVLIQKSETPIETDAQLQSALTGVDAEEKLELASLIKIAVDKNVDLPEGVESTLDLISNEQTAEEFKKTALEKDANIIEDTKEEIKGDKDLVNGLTGELVGNYIINSPVDYSNGAYHLELKADGKAVIVAKNTIETTWQQDESGTVVLAISEDSPLIISSETHLDPETGVASELKEAVFDISFIIVAQNSIFKTIELTQTLSQQSVNQSTTTVSKSVTNLFDKQQTISIEPADVIGQWSLQTFSKQQANADINQLKFNDDNSVTSSEFKNATWQLLGNTLQINYETSNGTADSLQLWLTKQYSDAYQFIALTGNAESSEFVEQGLFIKHDDTELTDASIKGKWLGYVGLNRPSHSITIFDDLSAGFGLNKGGWQTSLTGNTIMLSRYKLNGEVVSQCDEALSECVKEHKQLEVLASSDNRYFVNYKGSDISANLSDTGALTIFNYEKLILDQPNEDVGFTYAMFEEPSALYFDNGSGTTEYFNIVVEEVNDIKQGNLVIGGQSYSFNIAGGKISYTQDGKTYFIELLSQSEKGLEICWFQQGATCTDAQKGQLLFSVDDVTGYFVPQITFSPAPSEGYKEQVENQIKANVMSFGDEVIYNWQVPTGLDVAFSGLETDTLSFSTSDITSDLDFNVQLTVTDRLGQSTSQTQSIKVLRNTSQVTLSGIVTDSPVANAQVTAQAGQTSVQVQAGNDGTYLIELEVDETETEQLVMLSARGSEANNQTHIEFKSLLPSTTSLKRLAGEDGILNKEESFAVNVTNVSTAEFALLQQNGELPQSDAQLTRRQNGVDAQQKLELAALIKAVVDFNVDLPDGLSSTLELASNNEHANDLKAKLASEKPEIMTQSLAAIKADANLLAGVSGSLEGDYIINWPSHYNNRAIHISLNGDNSATVTASNQVNVTWQKVDNQVTVDLSTQALYLDTWHKNGNAYQKQLKSLSFILLEAKDAVISVELINGDVALIENGTEIVADETNALTGIANLLKKPKALQLSSAQWLGTWSIQTFNDLESDAEVMTFSVNADGTISEPSNTLTNWRLNNGHFALQYDDEGVTREITFWLNKEWAEGTAYQAIGLDNNPYNQTFYGLFVKHAEVAFDEENIVGRWHGGIGHRTVDFDTNIFPDLRVDDALRAQSERVRIIGGILHRGIYYQNGEHVDFCDTQASECVVYFRNELQALNNSGSLLFGYYQDWYFNGVDELEQNSKQLVIYEKHPLGYAQFEPKMLNFKRSLYYLNGDTYSAFDIEPQADGRYLVSFSGQSYQAQLVNGVLEYTDQDNQVYRVALQAYDFESLTICLYNAALGCGQENVIKLLQSKPIFNVTATTDGNGVITPNVAEVSFDGVLTLSIQPNTGFVIDSVNGCNGQLQGMQYVISNLANDCEVNATFKLGDTSVVDELTFYNPDYYRYPVYSVILRSDSIAEVSGDSFYGTANWFEQDGVITLTPIGELVAYEDNYLGEGYGSKQVIDSLHYKKSTQSENRYLLTINRTSYSSRDGIEDSSDSSSNELETPVFRDNTHHQTLPDLFTGEWSLGFDNDVWAITFNTDGSGFYKRIQDEYTMAMSWQQESQTIIINLADGNRWQINNTSTLQNVGIQAIIESFSSDNQQLATHSGLMLYRNDIAVDASNFAGLHEQVSSALIDDTSGEFIIFDDGHIGDLMSDYGPQGGFANGRFERYRYVDSETRQYDCDPQVATCKLATKVEYRVLAMEGDRHYFERTWTNFDFETQQVASSDAYIWTTKYQSSIKVPGFNEFNSPGRLYEITEQASRSWIFGRYIDWDQEAVQISLEIDLSDTIWMSVDAGKLRYQDPSDILDYYLELLDNDKEGITICRYLVSNTCQEQDHIRLVKQRPVHTITIEPSEFGRVGIESTYEVVHGESIGLSITADTGYELDTITGCNGYVEESMYVVNSVVSSCSITANFKEIVPLSEQAGITDEGLAQCVDNSGFTRLEDVTYLHCQWQGFTEIYSLDGLSALTNLEQLSLGELNLGAVIDLSELTNLKRINLYRGGQLEELIVHDPSLITELELRSQNITEIDLAAYTSLQRLGLSNNPIAEIDVSAQQNLLFLDLQNTNISNLNLAHNLLLNSLFLNQDNFTELNIGHLVELENLFLWNMRQVKALDVSQLSKLKWLQIGYMGVTSLNTSNLQSLEYLSIRGVKLDVLDLSNSPYLEGLDISELEQSLFKPETFSQIKRLTYDSANLTSIDLSLLTQLTSLNLGWNQLSSIDLPNPELLEELYLEGNNFASIDLSIYPNLRGLYLSNNPMTELELSHSVKLQDLSISNMQIENLDFSANNQLTNVYADSASLVSVTGLQVLDYKNAWLDFNSNPLSADTVAEFERLIQEEGFANLQYSIAYRVVINAVGEGVVSHSKLHLSDGQNIQISLWPNDGYEVGTITGCNDNFELLNGNTLVIGPIYTNCEIQVEFIEFVPLAEKAGVTDPTLAECVNNSDATQIEDLNSLWCGWSGSDVSVLEQLAPFNNLATLSISNLPRGSSVDLSFLQALRDITLSNSKVVGLAVYDESLIHALNLESNELTDSNLQRLDIGRFVNLQELGLAHNELEYPFIDEALPLTTLDLSYNYPIGEFAGELPDLSVFESLQVLRINGLRLRSIDYSHLTQLHTYHHADAGLTAFNTASLPNLVNLNLMSNPLNEGGLLIHKPEILVSLNVAFTKLTQLDTSLMTNLNEVFVQGSHIQSLDLTNNTLLNQLAAHNSYLQTVSGIEFIVNKFAYLDFNRTALTDETLSYVVALQSTYHNLFVSQAYLAEIHISEGGRVDNDFLILSENEQQNLWLSIDEGKEVASIQGCPGEFKGDYYELGPLTQNCRLDIVLQDQIALSIKAGIADSALATCVDESGNRYLELTHSLSCWNSEVTSLVGLESFLNLNTLNLGNLNLGDEIDLSHIHSLKEVSIDSSTFSSIKVVDPSAIEKLELTYSDLLSYDLSAYTGLISLNLSGNDGIIFDLSQVPNLKTLNLNNMSLDSLDLTHLNQLEHLSVYNNLLTDIDISHLNQLTYLDISSNDLTTITFTAEQSINNLNVAYNQLVSLDVSVLSVLNHLNAGGMSQLKNLVTSNGSLSFDYINISDSGIVTPDFTHLQSLRVLDVSGMLSENIDFAKLGNINDLVMQRSSLTTFDTAWVPSVERLSLERNKLTQINIANPEKLIRLELDNNELTQLDTTGLVNLGTLWIPNNPIGSLDLTGLEKLWQLGLSGTDIAEIDVMHTPDLSYINADNSGIQQVLNLESLQHKLGSLWLNRTPLTTEMQSVLADLSNQEGYGYISYSFAHSVVVKTNELGSVNERRLNTEDGGIRTIFFIPNEGYKLGSYSGCENMQYNEGNNWLNIGPITQSCELILEFVPIN